MKTCIWLYLFNTVRDPRESAKSAKKILKDESDGVRISKYLLYRGNKRNEKTTFIGFPW